MSKIMEKNPLTTQYNKAKQQTTTPSSSDYLDAFLEEVDNLKDTLDTMADLGIIEKTETKKKGKQPAQTEKGIKTCWYNYIRRHALPKYVPKNPDLEEGFVSWKDFINKQPQAIRDSVFRIHSIDTEDNTEEDLERNNDNDLES